MPTEAVQLARDVLARGRMPWLYRTPRPIVVATLRRFAAARWTARDIEKAVQNRLRERGLSVPAQGPDTPAAYLRWLLSSSDPGRPPARARDAEVMSAAAERRAHRAIERHQDQAAARVTVTEWAGRHPLMRAQLAAAGRAAAERAAARRAADRAREAAERAAAAQAARQKREHVQLPVVAVSEAACAGGCGTLSTDVVLRTEMPRPVPLCSPCWSHVRCVLG